VRKMRNTIRMEKRRVGKAAGRRGEGHGGKVISEGSEKEKRMLGKRPPGLGGSLGKSENTMVGNHLAVVEMKYKNRAWKGGGG